MRPSCKSFILAAATALSFSLPSLAEDDANGVASQNEVLRTVIVEQVQRGAPTWKEKLKTWRKNTVVAIKHLDIRKAQNWNDNVDFMKLKTKQAGPYLSTVCAATGILFNINNFKIRR